MEFDWDNMNIEILNEPMPSEFSYIDSPFQEDEQDYAESPNHSRDTTLSAMEFDMEEVLERNQFDPATFENFIEFTDPNELMNEVDALLENPNDTIEEISNDSYNVIGRNPVHKENCNEVVGITEMPFLCVTCTLDFPSEAYLIRHFNTKKHQRALGMEQRGRKVNQKRKYVRKNSCKMQTVQTIEAYEEVSNDGLYELINEDFKGGNAKNFYENFEFELEAENQN